MKLSPSDQIWSPNDQFDKILLSQFAGSRLVLEMPESLIVSTRSAYKSALAPVLNQFYKKQHDSHSPAKNPSAEKRKIATRRSNPMKKAASSNSVGIELN